MHFESWLNYKRIITVIYYDLAQSDHEGQDIKVNASLLGMSEPVIFCADLIKRHGE